MKKKKVAKRPRLKKIKEMWIATAKCDDGTEGLVYINDRSKQQFPFPCISVTEENFKRMRETCKIYAGETGTKILLSKFSVREDLGVIEP